MSEEAVTVAAVSDMHGRLEHFPECDIAVIAGDVCPIDNHSLHSQRRFLEHEFAPWLKQLPARHVVGIAGNHDLIFTREDEPAVAALPWVYLQDSGVELCGLRVYGTPWVPWLGSGWAFQAPQTHGEDFLVESFSRIPENLDVLVAHAPPYGLRDVNLLGEHAGSRALLDAVIRARPRLVVCGHLHEGRGATGMGSYNRWTLVANVCLMGWDYQPTWGPMVFSLPARPDPVEVISR